MRSLPLHNIYINTVYTPHIPAAHLWGRRAPAMSFRPLSLRYTGSLDAAELGDVPRVFHLPSTIGNAFRLGRATDNEYALYSNSLTEAVRTVVSRYHAQINVGQFGYTIVDLGSMNGTFVDGVRIKANVDEPIVQGSVIVIGGACPRACDASEPRATRAHSTRVFTQCATSHARTPLHTTQAARASTSVSSRPTTRHAAASFSPRSNSLSSTRAPLLRARRRRPRCRAQPPTTRTP